MNRLVWPAAAIFIFSFFCVGVVANSSQFQSRRGPSKVVPFWKSAFHHYSEVVANVSQIPEVCWSGNAVNEFQVQQCSLYWNDLIKAGGIALAPFLMVAGFIFLGFDHFGTLYKKAQKMIEKGKVISSGTVTHPAEAKPDLYSWFYCFNSVMIQLPDKTQKKVYVSSETALPLPGETLAVFELTSWTKKRRIAILYAPHIAVVRGGTRS